MSQTSDPRAHLVFWEEFFVLGASLPSYRGVWYQGWCLLHTLHFGAFEPVQSGEGGQPRYNGRDKGHKRPISRLDWENESWKVTFVSRIQNFVGDQDVPERQEMAIWEHSTSEVEKLRSRDSRLHFLEEHYAWPSIHRCWGLLLDNFNMLLQRTCVWFHKEWQAAGW